MDILQDKIVKCRKPHRCYHCGITIQVGEEARYVVSVEGGDFYSSYTCKYCIELADSLLDTGYLEYEDDGEYYIGWYREAAREFLCDMCGRDREACDGKIINCRCKDRKENKGWVIEDDLGEEGD